MKINSITYKWLLNFFVAVTFILAIIDIFIVINIKKYYYNYTEQTLNLNATANNYAIQYMPTGAFENVNIEIRNLIENFSNSDKIMAAGLDFDGNIVATSNGLLLNQENSRLTTAHYRKATGPNANDKNCKNIGYSANGEHIMTYIKTIPTINKEFSAIIYMTSLKKIDMLIKNISIILVIISLVVLSLVAMSGLFFIKSFVKPVKEISSFVKKINKENIKFKIEKNFQYEIKELCESINYMSSELHKSEYMKNEFISSVSHELRTPLTAIQGWSETILKTANKDKEILNRGMTVISKEVTRLSNMVEDLLDFSKIQNGHFKLIKDKMDLFAELEEAVLIYSDIAMREGKTLTYSEQEVVPTIFGDKNRIRQVFINVIDNALKYSDKGGVVFVEASVNEKTAKVVVKDNGCGISKKNLAHITEKFYKIDPIKKGSGIGLSIVKEIVARHDGKLAFESAQNKGTSVTIEFPLFHDRTV